MFIVWDQQITLDPKVFKISSDGKKITVLKDGIYKFDFQGLAHAGNRFYPYFTVNGERFAYGYGGSKHYYSSANMNIILKLKAGDYVSVKIQVDSHQIFLRSPYQHFNYMFIHKIA